MWLRGDAPVSHPAAMPLKPNQRPCLRNPSSDPPSSHASETYPVAMPKKPIYPVTMPQKPIQWPTHWPCLWDPTSSHASETHPLTMPQKPTQWQCIRIPSSCHVSEMHQVAMHQKPERMHPEQMTGLYFGILMARSTKIKLPEQFKASFRSYIRDL